VFRGLPSLRRCLTAGLCLLLLGAVTCAQAPVLPSGFLYHNQEFRFRVTLPSRNPSMTQQQSGTQHATVFESTARGDAYTMRVVIYQLDTRMAHLEFPAYFREFQEGMKYFGTSLAGCQQGAISDFPAERCVVSNYDGIGLMLLVRRGGVSYYVSATQDRAHNNDEQIRNNVSSFLLLPELEPFTFEEEGFRASFPAQPRLTRAKDGGAIVQAFAAANRYMTMVAIDDLTRAQLALDDAHLFASVERLDEQALASVHLRLTECAAVQFVGGLPAQYCTYTDERNAGKLLMIRRGPRLYSVLAHHPRNNGSDAEVEQFTKSFQFVP
jgi:hypothetical protein